MGETRSRTGRRSPGPFVGKAAATGHAPAATARAVMILALLAGVGCEGEDPGPARPDPPAARASTRANPTPSLAFEERLSLFYDREPDPDEDSVRWTRLPDEDGLARWDLSFRRWDGERVTCRLAGHLGGPDPGQDIPSRPRLAVYLHRAIEDRNAADEVAAVLAPAGYVVLAPDSPHRRRSTRVKGRQGLQEEIHRVRDAVLDARWALRYALSRGDVDPGGSIVLGASLGSAPAVLLGALVPEVRGVVSIVGGVSRTSDALGELTIPKQKLALVKELLDLVDPAHLVSRISPRPFLMINAEEDEVLPRRRAELLFERAAPPKEARWRPGGHRFPFRDLSDILIPWLRDTVKTDNTVNSE